MRRSVLFALAALAVSGCADSEKHARGWDYLPDMYESPAYRSNQAQAIVSGEKGKERTHEFPMMLPPVEGTVPRDFLAYQLGPNDWVAARATQNPLSPTAAVLRAGQANFNIYCVVCHGNDGNAAHGYVAATAEFPNRFSGILSLNTINVASMPEGEIYHIISMGRGRMPDYRAQLLPADRWSVVHYVKVLARATVAVTNAEDAFKSAQTEVARNPTSTLAKEAVAKAQALLEEAKRDQALIVNGAATADSFKPAPAPIPEYVKPEWPE